ILILASEVLAACISLVSATILVSIYLYSLIQINHIPSFKSIMKILKCVSLNVGNTSPRPLNSKVEQKEDTGRHTPFSVIFLARGKK
ncbi:hypothetical protein N309_08289, partial [Tinamus guttatus]